VVELVFVVAVLWSLPSSEVLLCCLLVDGCESFGDFESVMTTPFGVIPGVDSTAGFLLWQTPMFFYIQDLSLLSL